MRLTASYVYMLCYCTPDTKQFCDYVSRKTLSLFTHEIFSTPNIWYNLGMVRDSVLASRNNHNWILESCPLCSAAFIEISVFLSSSVFISVFLPSSVFISVFLPSRAEDLSSHLVQFFIWIHTNSLCILWGSDYFPIRREKKRIRKLVWASRTGKHLVNKMHLAIVSTLKYKWCEVDTVEYSLPTFPPHIVQYV